MSAIITTSRGGCCCICLADFKEDKEQLTHVGGEGHDGFHRVCLKSCLKYRSICPYDKQPINERSLLSLSERVMEISKLALFHTFCLSPLLLFITMTVKHTELEVGLVTIIAIGVLTVIKQAEERRPERRAIALAILGYESLRVALVAGVTGTVAAMLLTVNSSTELKIIRLGVAAILLMPATKTLSKLLIDLLPETLVRKNTRRAVVVALSALVAKEVVVALAEKGLEEVAKKTKEVALGVGLSAAAVCIGAITQGVMMNPEPGIRR